MMGLKRLYRLIPEFVGRLPVVAPTIFSLPSRTSISRRRPPHGAGQGAPAKGAGGRCQRRRRLRSRRDFRPAARMKARFSLPSTAPAKADASRAPRFISSSAGSGRRPGLPSVRTGFGILPLPPPSTSRRATSALCKSSPGTRTCGYSTPTMTTARTLQATWRGSWPGCRSFQDARRRGLERTGKKDRDNGPQKRDRRELP